MHDRLDLPISAFTGTAPGGAEAGVWWDTRGARGKFVVLYVNGAPERIRTSDLCLRRATLYPAELRVRTGFIV
jgi:hypothetical protein